MKPKAGPAGESEARESVAPVAAEAPPPPADARTADQFDTTTDEEKQAAAAAPVAAERELGSTIASLGDPTDPGFWAETPLVNTAQAGRLVYPGNGNSVQVELRPSGGEPGSGTRVSLPAFQVLGAPLTGLPELLVYAGSAG
ncbi:D-galactarate dehydratase [Vannielia litorea]|uniref:D-galactarate dehydratase n=1 Tax=Vannielia litorea TaxID=1217970 RepID=UPI0031405501